MDYGKVSVIVPIYKVESYLDQCVQSIVDQTYKNLEIILVDDGSRIIVRSCATHGQRRIAAFA